MNAMSGAKNVADAAEAAKTAQENITPEQEGWIWAAVNAVVGVFLEFLKVLETVQAFPRRREPGTDVPHNYKPIPHA